MGKYVGYTLLIIVVVVALEWLQIVDVPYFDIPDFTSGKKDMIYSTEDVLEKREWKIEFKNITTQLEKRSAGNRYVGPDAANG